MRKNQIITGALDLKPIIAEVYNIILHFIL